MKKLTWNSTFKKWRSWHPVPSLHCKQEGEKGKQWHFIFLGSKITPDGDCNHEIKMLAPWKESYDKPRQRIKKQQHHFASKGPSSQAMVFLVFMYGCERWSIKKAERRRIDAFKLCYRGLLRVPWTARRSNQSIIKESNPEYSLEGLMLKLKLHYFGHLIWKSWLTGKSPGRGLISHMLQGAAKKKFKGKINYVSIGNPLFG